MKQFDILYKQLLNEAIPPKLVPKAVKDIIDAYDMSVTRALTPDEIKKLSTLGSPKRLNPRDEAVMYWMVFNTFNEWYGKEATYRWANSLSIPERLPDDFKMPIDRSVYDPALPGPITPELKPDPEPTPTSAPTSDISALTAALKKALSSRDNRYYRDRGYKRDKKTGSWRKPSKAPGRFTGGIKKAWDIMDKSAPTVQYK